MRGTCQEGESLKVFELLIYSVVRPQLLSTWSRVPRMQHVGIPFEARVCRSAVTRSA